MKNFALAGTAMALALSAGSAFATPAQGTMGLNVDLTNSASLAGTPSMFMLKGKYFLSGNSALLAGLGLRVNDSTAANVSSTIDVGVMGGYRKYLKEGDFEPFFGGKLQYLSVRDQAAARDYNDFSLLGEAGAEYFFNKSFSVEGGVAAGYESQSSKPINGNSTTVTTLGTAMVNTSVNFYF